MHNVEKSSKPTNKFQYILEVKEYPPIVKVITFKEIDDFFEQVINFRSASKIDLSNYIFRGHSYENYDLIPTSLRIENKEKLYKIAKCDEKGDSEFVQSFVEGTILQQFYTKSDLQSLKIPDIPLLQKDNVMKIESRKNSLPESMHKLAGLAQHYGCYTRLLDWTNDINIALYFAITGNKENLVNIEQEVMDIWCLSETNIGLLNIGKNKNIGKLFIFRPQYKGNPNLAAQKGVFSLWNYNEYIETIDRRPLEEIIYAAVKNEQLEEYFMEKEPIFYLFKIPKKFIKELYNYLSHVNCTASKLFPGYDGVAKEIMQDSLYKL